MRFPQSEFIKLKEYMIIYKCALHNVRTRVDILLEDFTSFHSYNPIDHVKQRVKDPESIADKLHRQNFAITADNVWKHLKDVVGLRCICFYEKDIHYIANILKRQPDLLVHSEKDYVTNPKASGYRSFHLILEVPVHMSQKTEIVPVEVQIRTQAMEFWASLEHRVKYKYKDQMPEHLSKELIDCANEIAELDKRMFLVQEIVDMAYLPTKE